MTPRSTAEPTRWATIAATRIVTGALIRHPSPITVGELLFIRFRVNAAVRCISRSQKCRTAVWKVLCNRSLPHAAQRHRRAVRQRSSRINQRQTRTPVDAERTFVRRIASDCEFSQPSSCRTRRAPARNHGKPVHSSELRPVLSPPSIQRRRTAVQSKHRRPLQARTREPRARHTGLAICHACEQSTNRCAKEGFNVSTMGGRILREAPPRIVASSRCGTPCDRKPNDTLCVEPGVTPQPSPLTPTASAPAP